jgi:hypothetical protein
MKILLLLLTLIPFLNKAQSETKWFPSGFNIQPFTANFYEPRAGILYLFVERNLRLDIGYSSDVVWIETENSKFSAGADFFTFTRIREAENFHFPVEAVDYFFGLNAGYRVSDGKNEYGFRFRASHVSAHLADGRYIRDSNEWIDGHLPRVYSREFIEVFPFYTFSTLRVYAGLTYIVHVKPSWPGKGIYQLGFDYFLTDLINPDIIPFIAYDFRLSEVRKLSGNNIIYAGVKFGNYNSKGISVMVGYYSGKSVHGEFFENNENYFSAGINIEL